MNATDKIIEQQGMFFHSAALIDKSGLHIVTYAQIEQTNSSRFSFTFNTKWWAPIEAVNYNGKNFRLEGKTKRGLFRYVEF